MSYDGSDSEDDYGDREEFHVPSDVKSFVQTLKRHLEQRETYEAGGLYEMDYPELTDRYFRTTRWPAPGAVAPLVDEDETFMVLYRELYFRHVYTKHTPSIGDRVASFQNYVDLFHAVLGVTAAGAKPSAAAVAAAEEKVTDGEGLSVELPPQWIWDAVDEFIYQFQSFLKFRSQTKDLTEGEAAVLRANPHVWNAHTVFGTLHGLVRRARLDPFGTPASTAASAAANAHEAANADADDGDVEDDEDRRENAAEVKSSGGDGDDDLPPVSSYLKTVGQFGCIGLLRINCLVGDYTSGLEALGPVDFSQKRNVYTQVPVCHAALYYNMALAYLMLRRFADAISTVTSFVGYVSRRRADLERDAHSETIFKTSDRMHGLAVMAAAVCSQRLEEQIVNSMPDRFADLRHRLRSSQDVAAFQTSFYYSCPKYVDVAMPAALLEKKTKQEKDEEAAAAAAAKAAEGKDGGDEKPPKKKKDENEGADDLRRADKKTAAQKLQEKKEKQQEEEAKKKQEKKKRDETTYNVQWRVLQRDLAQRAKIPEVDSYLRMCTVVTTSKLAGFLESDSDTTVEMLLCAKMKSRSKRWKSQGAPVTGRWVTASAVDFYLDKDVVHVAEYKPARRFGDFFVRSIFRQQDTVDDLRRR